jgi:hypothetical protein
VEVNEKQRLVVEGWKRGRSGDTAVGGLWRNLGIAAIGLAVVGVYGVAAFATGLRTKEFGIRMALGAVKVNIIHLVLRTGAKPIAGGLLAGLCLALGASHGLAKRMKNAPFVLNTRSICLFRCLSAADFVVDSRDAHSRTASNPGKSCTCFARRAICGCLMREF